MTKHQAIIKLYPNVAVIRGNTAYDEKGNEVIYDDNLVEQEVAANQYKKQRQAEYPPLAEQLDYIYHNGVEAWKAEMIQPVKDKYPKPE